MRKSYRRSGSGRKSRGSEERKKRRQEVRRELPVQLPLDREELATMVQEALHSFAVEAGVLLAAKLLEDEVTQLCGPRYQWQSGRTWNRYGHQPGQIALAGQKVRIGRPRVRKARGKGEARLPIYGLLQREEAMPEAVLQRMVRGVSCRDYEGVVERAREGFGVEKSSVSRHFVKASAAAVEELAQRRWDGVRFPAIFIDGKEYAGTMMVVALGMTADGVKRVLGLREGATENAEVVTSLLAELCERGLDTQQPTLLVLDGAKALRAAVKRVWGRNALVQRCQVHKKRNIKAHLPEKHHDELGRRLGAAYADAHYESALAKLRLAARWLAGISPDAAASLREGMEETLTVVRLGVPELLRRTLATTNPIESSLDIVNTLTRRVKHWREGDMRQRWCTAGLMRAEEKFRRVKGYRQIPQLLAAMDADLLDSKAKAG
jgi:transposase-like protein